MGALYKTGNQCAYTTPMVCNYIAKIKYLQRVGAKQDCSATQGN